MKKKFKNKKKKKKKKTNEWGPMRKFFRKWEKCTIQSVQKACATFVKFVHTFEWENGTIINVKTPQYII